MTLLAELFAIQLAEAAAFGPGWKLIDKGRSGYDNDGEKTYRHKDGREIKIAKKRSGQISHGPMGLGPKQNFQNLMYKKGPDDKWQTWGDVPGGVRQDTLARVFKESIQIDEKKVKDDEYFISYHTKNGDDVELYTERAFKTMEDADKYLQSVKDNLSNEDTEDAEDERDILDSCDIVTGADLKREAPRLFEGLTKDQENRLLKSFTEWNRGHAPSSARDVEEYLDAVDDKITDEKTARKFLMKCARMNEGTYSRGGIIDVSRMSNRDVQRMGHADDDDDEAKAGNQTFTYKMYGIKIEGKVWMKEGKPVSFRSEATAKKAADSGSLKFKKTEVFPLPDDLKEGFAMDDIAVGGTVIYKSLKGYYKMSKVRDKPRAMTLRLVNGDTIENAAVVSTDASDWSKYRDKDDKKVVKENAELQSLGKGLKGLKGTVGTVPAKGAEVADSNADAEEPVTAVNTPPARKAEAEKDDAEKEPVAAFKVGDKVKPLIGPHKGQLHSVIHVFPDGRVNIKPDGLKADQVQYRLGASTAKPEQIELAESLRVPVAGTLLDSFTMMEAKNPASLDAQLEKLQARRNEIDTEIDRQVEGGARIGFNDPLTRELLDLRGKINALKKQGAKAAPKGKAAPEGNDAVKELNAASKKVASKFSGSTK